MGPQTQKPGVQERAAIQIAGGLPIPVLLVPVTAPWLKFSEVADYIRTVAPERGYWIHDALVNDHAAHLLTNLFTLVPAQSGPVSYLVPGTSVDL